MEFQGYDLYTTPNPSPAGWIAKNGTIPHTDRFHYGVILRRLSNGEYEVSESIASGVTLRRLFLYYTDSDVEVYRPTCPPEVLQEAVEHLSEIGGDKYDYRLFLTLGLDVANLIAHGKFPPYRAEQLKYTADRRFICTENANYGISRAHFPLVPDKVPSIPSSLKQAELDGKINRIYKGSLRDLLPLALAQEYIELGFWSQSRLPAPSQP